MKTLTKVLAVAAIGLAAAGPATARTSHRRPHTSISQVGGAAMYSNKTIVENAVNSPIHHTLVSAVQAAGLVDTLNGAGPFTVFAPTDDAFAALPAGTVDTLMQPANRATLTKVLTYHVVPGRITSTMLAAMIRAGHGTATINTVEGEPLTFTMSGSSIQVAGMGGSTALVTQANVLQSNGVIHVVDHVLTPTM